MNQTQQLLMMCTTSRDNATSILIKMCIIYGLRGMLLARCTNVSMYVFMHEDVFVDRV